MAKQKILLSTFSLRVFDKTNTEVNLDNFNNEKSFFYFLNKFLLEVYAFSKKAPEKKDKSVLHLRLKEKAKSNQTERSFSGYLSSGISGDKYAVVDEENKTVFEADSNKHITFRDLFFYIETPAQKNYAYVVIQRTKTLGAKHLLQDTLTKYLQENHYEGFRAILYNTLDVRVYQKMIELGNLKKIDFIKRTIPDSMEDYYKDPNKEFEKKGTLTTTIQARVSLTDYWKKLVNTLYLNTSQNAKIDLSDGKDAYDEVDFVLEYNGKTKKFHIQNKNRTQPDIDVTTDVVFKEGENEPTEESLIKISKELVADVLAIKIKNDK